METRGTPLRKTTTTRKSTVTPLSFTFVHANEKRKVKAADPIPPNNLYGLLKIHKEDLL